MKQDRIIEMNEIPTYSFALRADLEDNKFLPVRATDKSSGWDVFCAPEDRKPIVLRAGQYAKIPLGFRVIPPEGWWFQLVPRSSTFAKKALHCLYGTIDSDYRGQLVMAVQYMPDIRHLGSDLELKFGEAIGQIIPVHLQEMKVEAISNDEFNARCDKEINKRGAGGFGSTTDKPTVGFFKSGGDK